MRDEPSGSGIKRGPQRGPPPSTPAHAALPHAPALPPSPAPPLLQDAGAARGGSTAVISEGRRAAPGQDRGHCRGAGPGQRHRAPGPGIGLTGPPASPSQAASRGPADPQGLSAACLPRARDHPSRRASALPASAGSVSSESSIEMSARCFPTRPLAASLLTASLLLPAHCCPIVYSSLLSSNVYSLLSY